MPAELIGENCGRLGVFRFLFGSFVFNTVLMMADVRITYQLFPIDPSFLNFFQTKK